MKKTLSVIVGLLGTLCLFSSSVSVSAQPAQPIQVAPVQSPDVLRNYALASVAFGTRWVQAESMDWDYPGSRTQLEVTGIGAEEVLDRLFRVELQYRLLNGDDTIRGYINLRDSSGAVLFSGFAEYTAEALRAGKLPTYTLWIAEPPILKNVQFAEVLALGEDGVTARRYPLQVRDGRVLFQPWMVGAPNGLLAVRFKDGLVVTYELGSAVGEVPDSTKENASWKIDGHYVLSSERDVVVVKILESWIRPTVLLTVRSGQKVLFDVSGLVQEGGVTKFERPISLHLATADGTALTVIAGKPMPASGEVELAPGTYRIHFGWVKFGKPGMLYTGPTDGGKG